MCALAISAFSHVIDEQAANPVARQLQIEDFDARLVGR